MELHFLSHHKYIRCERVHLISHLKDGVTLFAQHKDICCELGLLCFCTTKTYAVNGVTLLWHLKDICCKMGLLCFRNTKIYAVNWGYFAFAPQKYFLWTGVTLLSHLKDICCELGLLFIHTTTGLLCFRTSKIFAVKWGYFVCATRRYMLWTGVTLLSHLKYICCVLGLLFIHTTTGLLCFRTSKIFVVKWGYFVCATRRYMLWTGVTLLSHLKDICYELGLLCFRTSKIFAVNWGYFAFAPQIYLLCTGVTFYSHHKYMLWTGVTSLSHHKDTTCDGLTLLAIMSGSYP